MTPEQFCYWLQGRAELMPDTPPSAAEWKMIAEHLATVFKKVTPPKAPDALQEALKKLQDEASKKTPPFYEQYPPAPKPIYRPNDYWDANRIYCQASHKTAVGELQC